MSRESDNVFLVGPMGSGKSTIGKVVALDLGYAFCDVDEAIECISGETIAALFARKGESWFRDFEEQYLDEITMRSQIVLSTGGGAVLRSLNRSRLHKRGLVIYLKAEAHILHERLKNCSERPLLPDDNRRDWLVKMLAERDHLYTRAAHYIVDVAEKNATRIASEIKEWVLSR